MRRLAARMLLVLVPACGPQVTTGNGGTSAGSTSTAGAATSTATSTTAGVDTSTGVASTSASTGGAVMVPAECTCHAIVVDDNPSCEDIAATECAGEPLCPALIAQCPRGGADLYDCLREYVFDAEVLTCMISALRDRTVGQLAIHLPYGGVCGFEGCGTDDFEFTITGSGQLVIRECWYEPLGDPASSSAVYQLLEADHFDGCLALGSTPDQFACMRAGIVDRAELCD